ncbi:MAG: hypothetical protein VST64_07560 [Nitrospirota bacterium]|nr:hypothetical protein [Nitrospirota bacterium]
MKDSRVGTAELWYWTLREAVKEARIADVDFDSERLLVFVPF